MATVEERKLTFEHNNDLVRDVYNIDYWGIGYFGVNDDGEMYVCPNPQQKEKRVTFTQLIAKAQAEKGSTLPTLFCFPQILQHRLCSINNAFKNARENFGYQGDYFLVYPIKVNQHRRVIESLINSKQTLGLEAGSKAELMAVLAHAGATRTVIVCNGYKDREYIRYALMGEKLGHKVYLVIEKISEIQLVLEEAKKLNVKPRLGVRARLVSQGKGKWQSSGGDKSKFGLSATQVLELVAILKRHDQLDSLQLLHFHLGSQLGNIRDVATGVHESARFYVELHKLGVNINCFDVGGGLGVDYEGNRTQSEYSVNYSLSEYAETVVWGIGQACEEHGLPHPTIITESGRGVTAHHAVLISNVIGVERFKDQILSPPAEDAPRVLHSMWETWCDVFESREKRSLRSWVHESQFDLSDVHNQYNVGILNLEQRAWAEQLYLNICHEIGNMFDEKHRFHRGVIDELQERFADKLYVNFSLFQSLPDAWGIDQLFPVCPLTNLNQPTERRALVLDITCDSDGMIKSYIDGDGIANTMPLPYYEEDEPPLLGFFMVGAYQEILGNMHNLFGDTSTIDVLLDDNGEIVITDFDEGNTVADMLEYVYLNPQKLINDYREQIEQSNLSAAEGLKFLQELESGLNGYTYLEEE
ncbi:biosynthetic arginine decarboxylase [Pasteurellaceae bacterium TAE3-ERU1]|nr:biosynthetic arginine decarboxylase [Pasteurellaceae bacterium TAE3-ERU1]